MNYNNQPLGTQGDTNEQEDQLSGTTNLSLNQLKKEGGTTENEGNNPDRLTDKDDLNEIRVADDLDEPDMDEYQSDSADEGDILDSDQNESQEEDSINSTDGI